MSQTRPSDAARLLLFGMWLGAAGCQYKPGSFTYVKQRFSGERVTVGCLDIAVERRGDHDGKPVLAYEFGNRCDRPAIVDLQNATVVGRSDTGAESRLAAYDPRSELRPLAIDGRTAGGEVLAYVANGARAQLCVDVASIARRQPARWVCFAQLSPESALAVAP